MTTTDPRNTALLVHIEHKEPIEVSDFVSSLNALNNLYSSFVKRNADNQVVSKSKLYVEKIENCCIDIYLRELATVSLLPFAENINILFEFAGHIKSIYEYFAHGVGNKPTISAQDCVNYGNMLNVVCASPNTKMETRAIEIGSNNVFNNCTFNFGESNGAKALLEKAKEELTETTTNNEIHTRVLMKIYQMRNEEGKDNGNRATIDEIIKGKALGVVFQTDELKKKILFNNSFNPNTCLFQVDVEVKTIEDRPKAYNILALYDIIDDTNN